MSDDIETRIRQLELELKRAEPPAKTATSKHPRRKYVLITVACLLAAGVIAGGYWIVVHDDSTSKAHPLSSILASVPHPVYVPSQLPDGFAYKPGSVSRQDGVLFYTLEFAKKSIVIVQQPLPDNDIGISSVKGFSRVDADVGEAYVGKNGEAPTAVVLTEKTLVNITATPDISSDVINGIVRNLTLSSR